MFRPAEIVSAVVANTVSLEDKSRYKLELVMLDTKLH